MKQGTYNQNYTTAHGCERGKTGKSCLFVAELITWNAEAWNSCFSQTRF